MECIVSDFTDWRNTARQLLQAGIHPNNVRFTGENATSDLFSAHTNHKDSNTAPESNVSNSANLNISQQFIKDAHWVSHHSSPDRWQLLYSLAWRQLFEDRYIMNNPVDHSVRLFSDWRKSVNRDYHKMKAFLRFQSIADFSGLDKHYTAAEIIEPETLHSKPKNTQTKDSATKNTSKSCAKQPQLNEISSTQEHFIAWFEPEHFIVPLASQFFAKRFSNMSWSILTPYECAHWHEGRLIFTDGATRPPLPEDKTEQLWLQYYGSIFNPARVKVKAMQAEMPKKYWKNLPESQLIQSLLQRAMSRVDGMVNSRPPNSHPD